MEEWKDIKDYKGIYQVSNLGNVRSLTRKIYNKGNNSIQIIKGRIIKPWKSKVKIGNYLYVTLSKNGIHYKSSIHRLVASTFIPNVENKKEVNHKDGNKENNNLNNLEWCTTKENQIHSWKVLKRKNYKTEYINLIEKISKILNEN